MMAGVYAAYVVVVLAYFGVAVTGYAAFGDAVNADVLLSVQHPAWLISAANSFVVVHLAASYQVWNAQSLEPPSTLMLTRSCRTAGLGCCHLHGFHSLIVPACGWRAGVQSPCV